MKRTDSQTLWLHRFLNKHPVIRSHRMAISTFVHLILTNPDLLTRRNTTIGRPVNENDQELLNIFSW